MSLTNADIAWNRSTIGDSEGGDKSATVIVSGAPENVFPNLTEVELAAGGERWRKIFFCNNSSGDDAVLPVFWISVMPTNVVEYIGFGVDETDDDDGEASGILAAWSANAIVELTSSGADTRTATVYGVDSGGDPDSEVITLNGTTPVAGLITWSKVHAVVLSALSASRTVTVKQGAAGTTRATIPVNVLTVFVWYSVTSKATGMHLENLGAGECIGIWLRQTWAAGAGGIRPNPNRIKFAEDV